MRIATLANASVIHTQRWVEYFRSRGHEVVVWSLEPGPPALGARILPRAPLPGFARYPLALPALKRALDRFEPDLVDAHFVPNYGLLGAAAGVRPLVITAWGSDLLVSVRHPLQRLRVRFVLGRADVVIADSANLAAAARALGAAPERVHMVPWGIDLNCFRPRPPREQGLLLSTRMHEEVYDLPTILRGAKPVLEARPGTSLVVAGDGQLRRSLERLAAEILPPGRYRFVGRLPPPAVAEWLGRATLYLSASRSDSTSLSLLEAMASGAIPVVSDLEGNREWIADHEGGRLFRPGDPHHLSGAIESVLDDQPWAESARALNRRVVESHGNWSLNMARIEGLFSSLVSSSAKRGAGEETPAAGGTRA